MAASLLLLASLLAASSARAEVESHGPVLAIEVGKAGLQGDGSPVFASSGWGKALVLGYRFDQLGVEWHVAQAYRLDSTSPVAVGDTTQGSLKLGTLGLRYTYLRRFWLLTAFAGVTRASLPLLIVDPALTGEGNVWRKDLRGVGPLAGAGLGLPIPGTAMQVLAEGRMAWCSWEQPLEYIFSLDESGGTVTWTTSTEPLDPRPWSLAIGLRAAL